MPRIKGSSRERKQRRNKQAVVTPVQGSCGARRLQHSPVWLHVFVGCLGREAALRGHDAGGVSGSERLSDTAGVVLECRAALR